MDTKITDGSEHPLYFHTDLMLLFITVCYYFSSARINCFQQFPTVTASATAGLYKTNEAGAPTHTNTQPKPPITLCHPDMKTVSIKNTWGVPFKTS